ncbi:hypothetical protein [Nostoc sp.]
MTKALEESDRIPNECKETEMVRIQHSGVRSQNLKGMQYDWKIYV